MTVQAGIGCSCLSAERSQRNRRVSFNNTAPKQKAGTNQVPAFFRLPSWPATPGRPSLSWILGLFSSPGVGWNRSGPICIGAAKKAFRAPPMRGPEKVYLSGIAAASAVYQVEKSLEDGSNLGSGSVSPGHQRAARVSGITAIGSGPGQ